MCECECVCVIVCVCVSVCLSFNLQHKKRMHHIILSSVTCVVVQYFTTFSHKRYDFRKTVTEHKMWAFVLCNSRLKIFSF